MAGRYRLPDPKCNHARRGIVEAGDPYDPARGHAATNVCDRPECIEDAMAWAEAVAREPARHRPDRVRSPEPTLFPEWVG